VPKPRRLLVDLDSTPYYHCINRCVRRAYLCGDDPLTGTNFDHRKQWLVDRMKTLAGVFAVDICSYSMLSNHFHLVLRIDAERGRNLSDAQVVERYGKLFPKVAKRIEKAAPGERARLISLWRERLWNLSWYMRCLNEAIARRANQEDGCTGRFWEGRFRSQALLDEGALLTCMSYVDLNPIRAGIADSLEASEFTSIRERLLAAAKAEQTPGAPATRPEWQAGELVPFAEEGSPPATSARWSQQPLPMRFEDYVLLLRETGGIVRPERVGDDALTGAAGSILEELGLSPSGFAQSVRDFARSFFTMVGERHRIEAETKRRGYRRQLGLRAARKLYRAA
jgi:REP element-mobilizing transposase RayT